MKFCGLMRIKNEAAWIGEVIQSLLPLCERVVILDDHSTDNTVEICRTFPQVELIESPFEGLNEKRDKDLLLNRVIDLGAENVIHIDGDEVLYPGHQYYLNKLANNQPDYSVVRFRVVYAWNDRRTIRTDGIYAQFMRPSMFRLKGQPLDRLAFMTTGFGGNLHCWNHPQGLVGPEIEAPHIRLLHYGYISPEIRARKHAFYNKVDPDNSYEDRYQHVWQGDPGGPPADARLKHAGPLRLEPLNF